ncbi:MAG: hypothetical protein KF698_07330 [Anaerolineales bacterium]|nr:hypothetical protein [Anaerolineales bacterium]
MSTLKRVDFDNKLDEIFGFGKANGIVEIVIRSGDLHRAVGGYPGDDHRMPVCCEAMRSKMRSGDSIIEQPPKGDGANLVIRYLL